MMQHYSNELAFEKAASYRDRLKMLSYIQARQRINLSGIRDADVIAIVQIAGQTCIQIFFFRNGRNFGTQAFFLKNDFNDIKENFSAFINQFYESREPAKLVLLNTEPAEFDLIKQALAKQYPHKITWQIPKVGYKKEVLEHAVKNATQSLERKQVDSASMVKIFKALQEVFELQNAPNKIEVYDNSHVQGKMPYGVMIVATQQGFEKQLYRKFSIKYTEDTRDDYAMMREVLERRLNRANQENWQLPDLFLIDGGKGQLNVVRAVLEKFNIDVPVVAIAKGIDRNAGKERFFMANKEFSLDDNCEILYFLQKLRDEAHRFAIGTHRARRTKIISKSQLDEVVGIGAKRKKILLHHFGSVRGVAGAGLGDLEKIKGINKAVALKIYQHFNER